MCEGGESASEGPPVRYGEDEFGEYRIDDRVWTMNEIRDHPLFMEDVPRDISDNPELLALQSLVYDGNTDEEMAEHFRKLGNEAFRLSTGKIASQNALLAYTKGLEMECKDGTLNSQLYSNRAAVSLRVGEYQKAVDDCRRAILQDPANIKARFRGAKASEALGLTSQAIRFCDGALALSPAEKEVLQLRERLARQLAKEEKGRQDTRQAERGVAMAQNVSDAAAVGQLEGRGLSLGPLLYDVGMYVAYGKPKPKTASDGGAIEWPMLMLYDEVSQSDFVETFDERCTLGEQLQLMFPPDRPVEWDSEGKYQHTQLVVFLEFFAEAEGVETRMARVDLDAPLADALARVERVSPCLPLHVLVRHSPALRHFCEEHSLPPA
mmetsp:Transcript_110255/g.299079  ORF Transcript_110255/g.299079 Transcript_110255/m.299079 type:complete len:380 (+) Transcript_110255:106-1245(+)